MAINLLEKIEGVVQHPSFKKIIIGVVFFIMFLFLVGESLTIIQIRYNMGQLSQQATNYKNENKVLSEKIQVMNSDQYIQKMATTKLGMVMGNQIPVKVVVEPVAQAQNNAISAQKKISIYMKMWYEQISQKLFHKK